MGRFVLVADRTGNHKLLGVFLQGLPQKPQENNILSPSDSQMTVEPGGVGPLDDVGPQGWGNR